MFNLIIYMKIIGKNLKQIEFKNIIQVNEDLLNRVDPLRVHNYRTLPSSIWDISGRVQIASRDLKIRIKKFLPWILATSLS